MDILSRFRRKYSDAAVKPSALDLTDDDGEVIATLHPDGRLENFQPPVAPPVGYQRTVPLHLQIREMVRSEALRMAAEAAGAETFEEADDFDVDDDFDPTTPYENDFDPPLKEIREDVERERASKAKTKSVPDDQSGSGIQPTKSGGSAEPKEGSATEE